MFVIPSWCVSVVFGVEARVLVVEVPFLQIAFGRRRDLGHWIASRRWPAVLCSTRRKLVAHWRLGAP